MHDTPGEEAAPQNADSVERSRWARWRQQLEIDPAVAFAVASRAWQLLAGPLSLFVILRFYSGAEQGLFYMFANLVLWHGFVELGLQTVIATIASHDWAELSLDAAGRVIGPDDARQRLGDLSQSAFRWYAAVAGLFALAIGGGGYWLLASRATGQVAWQGPWAAVMLLTAPSIWWSSRIALLEGCNQLGVIHRYRFVQAVVGNLAVWAAISLGFSLWATVVSAVIRLGMDGWLLFGRYRRFFDSLPSSPQAPRMWREQIWPLQWRMAIRSLLSHLGSPLLLPVIYAYQGEVTAGVVGMTMQILQAVEGAAFAWIQTRVPRLGMLVARRDFDGLDQLFRRVLVISSAVLLVGGIGVTLAVWMLTLIPHELAAKIAGRLEDAPTTLMLVGGMLSFHIARALGAYVYVHKRDPFLIPQLIASSSLGLLIWLGGRNFGVDGAVLGYLLGNTFGFLPLWWLVFNRCRREWH